MCSVALLTFKHFNSLMKVFLANGFLLGLLGEVQQQRLWQRLQPSVLSTVSLRHSTEVNGPCFGVSH